MIKVVQHYNVLLETELSQQDFIRIIKIFLLNKLTIESSEIFPFRFTGIH